MSSTNRGYNRHVSDYYVTPEADIKDFLSKFFIVENITRPDRLTILDPSCGGSDKDDASYVKVFNDEFDLDVTSIDIRDDSKADIIDDYLKISFNKNEKFDMIITNPPFYLAMEFIKKSFELVNDGGYIVMLLRLNFFGSKIRKPFFDDYMPKYAFIHHKRISFLPRDVITNKNGQLKTYKKGSTDSIEYAHFIWKKGDFNDYTKVFVI